VLVFSQRPSRHRARAAAVAEALALLHDLEPSAPAGGPLSERGGVFWVDLPEAHLAEATARLPRLGYTTAVDRLVPAAGPPEVRWRRRPWRLVRLWEEDAAGHRELAPDRREFLFAAGGGPVRPVRGYRGGGGPLTRRGLPVCDARLLVNLVAPAGPGRLLDPFAGVGGVALEARAAGWTTVTADLDPGLRHGLGAIAGHLVADARALPLRPGSLDAAVTEPPYDRAVGPLASQALRELHRLLRPGGAAAVLAAAWQAPGLRSTAAGLGWRVVLDCPVDRKGLEVVALAWRRP
jgi:SAM-dependent methyltransferase